MRKAIDPASRRETCAICGSSPRESSLCVEGELPDGDRAYRCGRPPEGEPAGFRRVDRADGKFLGTTTFVRDDGNRLPASAPRRQPRNSKTAAEKGKRPELPSDVLASAIRSLLMWTTEETATNQHVRERAIEFIEEKGAAWHDRDYASPLNDEAFRSASSQIPEWFPEIKSADACPFYGGRLWDELRRPAVWELVLDRNGDWRGSFRARWLDPKPGENTSKDIGAKRLHYAQPRSAIGWHESFTDALGRADTLVVTESVRKANEVTRRCALPAVGISGVSSSQSVLAELAEFIRETKPGTVVLAFDDGDLRDGEERHDATRRDVLRTSNAIFRAADAAGSTVLGALWNTDEEFRGNGPDDALAFILITRETCDGLPEKFELRPFREWVAKWKWHDDGKRRTHERAILDRVGELPAEPAAAPRKLRGGKYRHRAKRERAPHVIAGLLRAGHVGFFYGKPSARKTYAILDVCLHVALGRDVWGRWPSIAGDVVYATEEGEDGIGDRIDAWVDGSGANPAEIEARFTAYEEVPRLLDPESVGEWIAAVREDHPDGVRLLVLDTWTNCIEGDDGDGQGAASAAMSQVKRINRELGCATILIDHEGWSAKRMRGSSAKVGAADLIASVTAVGELESDIVCAKHKHGRDFDAMTLRFEAFTLGIIEDWPTDSKPPHVELRVVDYVPKRVALTVAPDGSRLAPAHVRILRHLLTNEKPVSNSGLGTMLKQNGHDASRQRVSENVAHLRDAGLIEDLKAETVNATAWVLTSDGKQWCEQNAHLPIEVQ